MFKHSILLSVFLLSCGPNIVERHMNLAEQYLRQGSYKKAIEEYTRVANLKKSDPLAIKAHENIARVYRVYLKDPERAIRTLRGVLLITQNDVKKKNILISIATIYFEDLNNPQQASIEYQNVYQNLPLIDSERPQILLSWAEALTDASMFDDAVNRYQDFLLKYPEHPQLTSAKLGLGQSLLAGGNADKSLEVFKSIIDELVSKEEENSSLGEAFYGLGNVYEYKEDFNKALEAYGKSLDTYPNRMVVELKIRGLRQRLKESNL